MSNLKLKPCPLCGGEAIIEEEELHWDNYYSYTITCANCGVTISGEEETKEDAIESAIDQWNRRTCTPDKFSRKTPELKICPFCGSRWSGGRVYFNDTVLEKEDKWEIYCDGGEGCAANTKKYNTKEEAVEAWNKRQGDNND